MLPGEEEESQNSNHESIDREHGMIGVGKHAPLRI
jgi:hypothetical protein